MIIMGNLLFCLKLIDVYNNNDKLGGNPENHFENNTPFSENDRKPLINGIKKINVRWEE